MLEDEKIVDLYLKRKEEAIHHTSLKYGSRLRTLSNDIVDDLETAKECENDTYVKAWNSIPPNEPREYLYPFLAKIIRRISLNCCRDRKRLKRSAFICELSSEMEQCIPAPNDCECHMDDLLLKECINSFLEGLSEEKRMIFLRRYWFLDSVSSISRRLCISESKVKTSLFRSRNELRKFLEKEGYTL